MTTGHVLEYTIMLRHLLPDTRTYMYSVCLPCASTPCSNCHQLLYAEPSPYSIGMSGNFSLNDRSICFWLSGNAASVSKCLLCCRSASICPQEMAVRSGTRSTGRQASSEKIMSNDHEANAM